MRGEKRFGAVILAAGASKRMGTPKSSLQFSPNKTFVSRLLEVYANFGCGSIVVVANPDNVMDILVSIEAERIGLADLIVNKQQDSNRVYSLQLGLEGRIRDVDYCFVQDVDRPCVSLEAVQQLGSLGRDGFWSFLKYNNRKGHPVLISKKIMDHIRGSDVRSLVLSDILSVFPSIGATTEDDNILMNINTQEEYKEYFGTSLLNSVK